MFDYKIQHSFYWIQGVNIILGLFTKIWLSTAVTIIGSCSRSKKILENPDFNLEMFGWLIGGLSKLFSLHLSKNFGNKLFNFEKARNRTRERGLFLIQRLARKDRTSPQSREGLRTEQGPVHRNHPSPDPKSANGRPLAKVFKNLNSAVWG